MMIKIARSVPLGCTNLSQLNLRAKRLQLSGYQLMLDSVMLDSGECEDIKNIKRLVDTSLLQLINQMHMSLFCFAVVCALFGMYCLHKPTNAVSSLLFLHIHSLVQVFWHRSVGSDVVSTS